MIKVRYSANDLRNGAKLMDLPGNYKWWANIEDFKTILNALELDFSAIEKHVESMKIGEGMHYCIYTGVAIDETAMKREQQHINSRMSRTAINASTLKKSIVSLFFDGTNFDEATVKARALMGRLYAEFSLAETSEEEAQIKAAETEALNKEGYLYVLNVQENKNEHAPKVKLKERRRRLNTYLEEIKRR